MGMATEARTTRRVNLRIDEDTYLAFEKVAKFFNRSVASMVRETCEMAVPTMRDLGEMIDQAKAGNPEAAQRVFHTMLEGYTRQIAEVGQTVDTILVEVDDGSNGSAGASNTAL
jgi:hypothetical protein